MGIVCVYFGGVYGMIYIIWKCINKRILLVDGKVMFCVKFILKVFDMKLSLFVNYENMK